MGPHLLCYTFLHFLHYTSEIHPIQEKADPVLLFYHKVLTQTWQGALSMDYDHATYHWCGEKFNLFHFESHRQRRSPYRVFGMLSLN